MRFLADVCCPKQVEDLLIEAGHDVLLARTVAHDSADTDLLAWATRERRVIVTRDKDYGDLTVANEEPAHRVVLFRLPGRDGAYHAERRTTFYGRTRLACRAASSWSGNGRTR